MSLETVLTRLTAYPDVMDFKSPAGEEELNRYEKETGLVIPGPLRELLRFSNGGEIFVPGTVFFGTEKDALVPDLAGANGAGYFGDGVHIPGDLLVFACFCFGDPVCISTDGTGAVIQWDLEEDEVYLVWDSLEDFLEDSIEDYEVSLNESC